MAFDTFLTIPGIPGESVIEGFRDTIEIYSFSWALSSPATLGSAGFTAGKPQFSDFTVVKRFDKSSPKLMQALVGGQHLQRITLSLVQPVWNTVNKPFLTYQLDNVLVTSCSDSGSVGGDSYPYDNFSFAMTRATVTYYQQNPDGSPNNVQFTYDISKNA